MTVYHVSVQKDEGWYVAEALEDPSIFTQGRTLDEIIANIREVAELRRGRRDVHVELIVPASLTVGEGLPARRRGRAASTAKRSAKRGKAA